jgi:hypothetical protein
VAWLNYYPENKTADQFMNAAGWASTAIGLGLLGLVALDIYRTIPSLTRPVRAGH